MICAVHWVSLSLQTFNRFLDLIEVMLVLDAVNWPAQVLYLNQILMNFRIFVFPINFINGIIQVLEIGDIVWVLSEIVTTRLDIEEGSCQIS